MIVYYMGWKHGHNCTGATHMTKDFVKTTILFLQCKNGYLSCTFVFLTLGTEQRYKECARCVGYHPGGISGRINDSPLVWLGGGQIHCRRLAPPFHHLCM